ncbi:MAG: phosphate ABC transporter ATP-binding protein [Vicinamibacterales bacterium]
MSAGEAVYRLESVRHRYGERVVLQIDRLDVFRGETLSVVGPSGAGKSTLLRLLQFLERPTEGTLLFEGQAAGPDVPLDVRRKVTTVFQRPVMLNRSVRANVAYGLRVRGAHDNRARVDRLLESLGLTSLASAPARTLSGGEVQRVAFGRALAFEPPVLLLDEPTANLDPRNVRLVEGLIHEQKQRGVTIVLATHQTFQARRLGDRTAFLLEGRIVEARPTHEFFEAPLDARTRAFLSGDMIY